MAKTVIGSAASNLAGPLRYEWAVQAQDEEPEKELVPQVGARFRMNDSQIEQWVFGKDLDIARRSLRNRLEEEINRADHKYHLDPGQKKKLEVAGHGDMKRLFDRFEEFRKRVNRREGDLHVNGVDFQELQSLQKSSSADLFGDDSMVAKTLKRILTPQQVASHEKDIYRSKVDLMVALLARAIGLNEDQHRRLVYRDRRGNSSPDAIRELQL